MFEKLKGKLNFLKQKKTAPIIIAACVAVIILLILSETFSHKSNVTKENAEDFSFDSYTHYLEEKLESIVSSIDGAGECRIMVTLDTGEESIYAKQAKNQNEDRSESSKSSGEYEYVILKSSSSKEEGMLLKVIEPNVRGVAIVCRGGDDPRTKENIISAVSAVLSIKSNKISITKMKE